LLKLHEHETGKSALAEHLGHKTVSGELHKQIKHLLDLELIEMTKLFEQIKTKKSPQFLEFKFNLGINIIVTACQSKCTDVALVYEETVNRAFQGLMESDHLSDFSRNILISRFYRGISYCPYIRKNNESLIEMAELCESHARQAVASNEIEKIIRIENICPMLETTGRIYEHVGNLSRAQNHLEELVYQVEPADLKMWMQLGDFYFKTGQEDRSMQAYLKAENCQAPHLKILFFKMGLLAERLGQRELAIESYQKCLVVEPSGRSPRERLNTLITEGIK
jgi:tetratricopeptide (TPR) repeat protein